LCFPHQEQTLRHEGDKSSVTRTLYASTPSFRGAKRLAGSRNHNHPMKGLACSRTTTSSWASEYRPH